MSPLIMLIVFLIVLGLLLTLVQVLINALPILQPFKVAIWCLVILLAIVVLLDETGLMGGGFHGFACR